MSPAIITAAVIDNMIGSPHLISMCEVGGRGNITEVKVTNPKVVGRTIREINFPEKSLIVMIRRGYESIIAHSSLVLEYGDIATIIGEGNTGKNVSEILHK